MGSSQQGKQQQEIMNISFGGMDMDHHQPPPPPPSSSSSSMHASASFLRSKESSAAAAAYDIGELDQALFMYLEGQQGGHASHQEQRQTLNIFPSQPMHVVEPSAPKGEISLVLAPAPCGSSKRSSDQHDMEGLGSQRLHDHVQHQPLAEPAGKDVKPVAKKEHKKGVSTMERDPKTLRRLAQNREAARKSRLRKKAYIQQLESGRIKLAQLEQELQMTRTQGMFFGIDGLSSAAAMFDVEHVRWQEEHGRRTCELRAALQHHLPEGDLQAFVDSCLEHHDELLALRDPVIRGDVLHLISGFWKSPAERCFLWLAGFRPSDLIKMLVGHIQPLTEQQILAVYGLQQSTQEAEEALNGGLDALHQSLSDTIASDALAGHADVANYMGQMAVAMSKLSTLEGFVRQADSLRHQMLHRLRQILTTRQMARSLVAMADYFDRVRALSSLWLTRPRND